MLRNTLLAAAVGAAALAVPGVASASSVVDSFTNHLASDTQSLGTYSLNGYDVLGVSKWDVDVTSRASWTADLRNDVIHDDSLRQGATTTVNRLMPLVNGTMKVSWQISGSVKVEGIGGSFSSKNLSVEATCLPATLGEGSTCTANSPAIYLLKTPGLPLSPYVKLFIKTKFNITPEGVITNRTFSAGSSSTSASQTLTQAISPETLKVPCAPVGSSIGYRLGQLHYSPKVAATQSPAIQVGLMDPVLGLAESPALYDGNFGPSIKANPAFDLYSSGHTYDFGDLAPNNVKPTVSLPTTFTGTAGEPIGFYAGASGACAIESYEWHFSNGTTSYGSAPLRTFNQPGSYDGQLVVTDESGMKTTKTFSVTVKP